MKISKKVVSAALSAAMLLSSVQIGTVTVSAAPAVCAGWYETLYAEWADSDPDAANVKVGYRRTGDEDYTYLSGDDLTYLVRKAETDGYGRVDIPGLKEGRYDIEITASNGAVHTRNNVLVYGHDRSGYAHWKYDSGVGAYNNDGTPKENALIVYVTDENKNTVSVPGYNDLTINYSSSSTGAVWTRGSNGIGNILNNNHKLIRKITGPKNATISGFDGETYCDDHPIIFRFIGEVTPPENLTPYNAKTNELGGSKGDNGNLAITKYAKNITIEGIGEDAVINGWGFTFSQTSTCPADAGESFEVRNLTFKNYPEDALGFQGDDGGDDAASIQRVWVHNNVFYPGYCANPTESDKSEGDGSCDFKRGRYYTMSYNHYVKCHKTNLLGKGAGDEQFYATLHHNWYEDVASRQPLAADGNIHIYNTYFQDTGSAKKHNTSQVIDLRGMASCFAENNYFENCKNYYKTRNAGSYLKLFGNVTTGDTYPDSSQSGKVITAEKRTDKGLENGLLFPDKTSMDNWDLDPEHFYGTGSETSVKVLNKAEEVPEYVTTYAGTQKTFPLTESGMVSVTVVSGGSPLTDADVTANGVSFVNNGDGTYTAASVPLESEITVKASKEGYSNRTLTAIVYKDGEVFSGTLDLPQDSDGYAGVKLTGGSDNAAVTGVSVKLADGTVLADKGNGVYMSEKELPVGTYEASVTDTGDYKPLDKVSVTVRTTDALTEVHLEKETGLVSVTLKRAASENSALDLSRASVKLGETELTNNGDGTFTGSVEVGTPFDVIINVPGWKLETLTPAAITASVAGTASAVGELVSKGSVYTWNYTEDINTEDFFVFGTLSAWSSAKNNVVEYEGEELNKAVKVNGDFVVTFDAPADGVLTIVSDAKENASLLLNGDKVNPIMLTDKILTIPVKAGINELKKNKNESHLYLLEYAQEGGSTLSCPVEWDITSDLSGTINGLTFGEKFSANSEESGKVTFTELNKEDSPKYMLGNYVQGSTNPLNAAGTNPQAVTAEDHIPASGAYLKFEPDSDGNFVTAVKTGGDKTTYITDGDGNVITQITDSATTYYVVNTPVEKGKTYYMYAGGSKMSLYYIGFTPSEGPADDETMLGDVNCDTVVDAADSALALQYVLNRNSVKISEQGFKNMQVTKGEPDASTSAAILQKALVSTFKFEVEK